MPRPAPCPAPLRFPASRRPWHLANPHLHLPLLPPSLSTSTNRPLLLLLPLQVEQLMAPICTVSASADIGEASSIMSRHDVSVLLVDTGADGGGPGFVTRRDFLKMSIRWGC